MPAGMTSTSGNFVCGECVGSVASEIRSLLNPATDETIGVVPEACEADIERVAYAAAVTAAWATRTSADDHVAQMATRSEGEPSGPLLARCDYAVDPLLQLQGARS